MNTSNKLVNVAIATLGAIHFVAQTTADICLKQENKLQHKHNGLSIEEARQQLIDKTYARQAFIKAKIAEVKANAQPQQQTSN